MIDVATASRAGVIIMHMQAPTNHARKPAYESVVDEVFASLKDRYEQAQARALQ